MRALQLRLDRVQAAMPAPASVDRNAIREAVNALDDALDANFPHPPTVYAPSPYSHARLVAAVQPPSRRDQIEAWARRVSAGEATESDAAVSATLPAWALARINLAAVGYAELRCATYASC